MTKDTLIDLIDLAYLAVDQSRAGPIWYNQPLQQANSLGLQTFQTVLSNIISKRIDSSVSGVISSENPKEPWEE